MIDGEKADAENAMKKGGKEEARNTAEDETGINRQQFWAKMRRVQATV